MAAELNFAHAQLEESQYDIQSKNQEIQELKQKFYSVKKQEQQLREKERERTMKTKQANAPTPQPSAQRFVGGGFSLDRAWGYTHMHTHRILSLHIIPHHSSLHCISWFWILFSLFIIKVYICFRYCQSFSEASHNLQTCHYNILKMKRNTPSHTVPQEQPLQALLICDTFTDGFGPATQYVPEMLFPLCNVPLIHYTLQFLVSQPVSEIFVVSCKKHNILQRYLMFVVFLSC